MMLFVIFGNIIDITNILVIQLSKMRINTTVNNASSYLGESQYFMRKPAKFLFITVLACVFTTPMFTGHALADDITQSSSTLSKHLETEPSSTENLATSTTDTPVSDLSTLNVKDISVAQNTEFKNEQIFDSATDITGNPLQVDDITITGIVDTTKIGTYELKVTNGTLEKTVKVTVETNLAALNVKNISIMQNSLFTNDMIFDSAIDISGNKLTLADLAITGTVDTSKAGTYTLTVVNGSIAKTVTVTVKADLTTLNVKNVSLTQGSSFNYASFFLSATDANGKAVKVTDLKVTGSVTTGKIGAYTLTVTNGSLVKKVTVIVTAIPIKKVAVYRMYNPDSYEHFYTKDYYERTVLVKRGWTCEGTAWYAPDRGNAIYRLYLGAVGEHFYSTNLYEKNILVSRGWKYEGIAFYSGGAIKTYRTYNSGIKKHNFTTDFYEQKVLTTQRGWKNEGIAWYVYQAGDKNGAEVGKKSGWYSINGTLKYYNASTTSYTKQFSMPYYSQRDPRWVNKYYAGYTLGNTGCGMASIAMIVSGFGKAITPVQAADYAHTYGSFDRYPEVGSAQSDLTMVASHWGINYKVMSSSSQIASYLSQGYPATVCLDLGNGVRHIVVLRGYSGGYTTVTDPWNGAIFSGRHSVSQVWSLLSWKVDNKNRGASAAVVYILN